MPIAAEASHVLMIALAFPVPVLIPTPTRGDTPLCSSSNPSSHDLSGRFLRISTRNMATLTWVNCQTSRRYTRVRADGSSEEGSQHEKGKLKSLHILPVSHLRATNFDCEMFVMSQQVQNQKKILEAHLAAAEYRLDGTLKSITEFKINYSRKSCLLRRNKET